MSQIEREIDTYIFRRGRFALYHKGREMLEGLLVSDYNVKPDDELLVKEKDDMRFDEHLNY